jgi:hypothetical protein
MEPLVARINLTLKVMILLYQGLKDVLSFIKVDIEEDNVKLIVHEE